MKTFKRIMLVAGGMLLLSILLVTTTINLQQSRHESEAIAIRNHFMELDVPTHKETAIDVEPEIDSPEQELSETDSHEPETLPQDGPPPLERVPDRSVLQEMIPEMDNRDYWEARLTLSATRITRAIPGLNSGIDPSAFSLGQRYLEIGDFDEAKAYFWQEVDSEHEDYRLSALLALAYLEEDPRVVEKLLYQSCEEDHLSHLAHAVEFCDKVGSDTLRDYYVRRLFAAYPEEAAEFMKRFEP
ncbi:MAG: hypothetical protein VCD00_20830 [Candidatus Hydrogenedentota bacterium]